MLHRTIKMLGFHIHARDGVIGHIDDFLVDEGCRAMHYLVVDTSNWIGRRSVLITGHGPTMTPADLREFGEFSREFVNTVQQAKRSGQTIDQFISTWKIPARFTGYTQPQPEGLRPNTQVVWDETN